MKNAIRQKLVDYANIAMAIIAAMGLVFVICEFREIRKQNMLTEIALKESFNPILIFDFSYQQPYSFAIDSDSLVLVKTDQKLVNEGKGIAFFIGYIKYCSYSMINFYSKSLVQNIKEKQINIQQENMDGVPSEQRLNPLKTKDSLFVNPFWIDLKLAKGYYFYTIALYKDQSNNLFDTVHLTYRRYEKQLFEGGQAKDIWWNEYYHSYSIDEHNYLYNYFKYINHPIANFIGQR